MRIFIDDSGGFGWAPPQISLHCGVVVCSLSLVELFRRHFEWKSLIGAHKKREIKASSLTDDQLEAFVKAVIIAETDMKLIVVGIDTSLAAKEVFEKWRDGISLLCQGAAQRFAEFPCCRTPIQRNERVAVE